MSNFLLGSLTDANLAGTPVWRRFVSDEAEAKSI